MSEETLNKSIDAEIDAFYARELAKAAPLVIKADDAVAAAPKPESSKKDKNRPKTTNEVPETDEDGNHAAGFDVVQSKQSEEQDEPGKKIKVPAEMKKSTVEISVEDFAKFQALCKAESEQHAESLRKSNLLELKAAMQEALAPIQAENAELRKSIANLEATSKAVSNKPQTPRAVDAQPVERFSKSNQGSVSKEQLMDIAEGLFKSGHIQGEQLIELERSGYIYDANARATLERAVAKAK